VSLAHKLRTRWASLFRFAAEQQLQDELRFHLAEQIEENVGRGMNRSEAERVARITLGGVEQIKEEARAMRFGTWLETLWQDTRYAWRVLRRGPGFTVVAVLALALGIGANTAIFSLVDALLFRSLNLPQPEQVVRVHSTDEAHKDKFNSSYPVFADYRDQSGAFSGLAAFDQSATLHISSGQGPAQRVSAAVVSGNFFEVLGTRPALGRLLTAEDDRQLGAHPVTVLSYRLWRRLGGSRDMVGSTLRVSGHSFTVIGVAPADFAGVNWDSFPEMWIPMAMVDVAMPEYARETPLTNRRFSWIDIVGRLRDGVSTGQAQAQLEVIAKRRTATQGKEADPMPLVESAASALLSDGGEARRVSWMLLGVVGLLLIISCAVTAGLLLVRAERRQREIAVRLAIGASAGRIFRQLLVESVLLAGLGALAGLAMAAAGSGLLVELLPPGFPIPLDSAVSILDARILGFTLTTALLAGLLFGIVPALGALRGQHNSALKEEVPMFARRLRVFAPRNVLVALQVALSVMVLAGAGLLLRTLWLASHVELGFQPDGVVLGSVDVARQGYSREKGVEFFAQLLRRLQETPGVESVALGSAVPIQASGMRMSLEIDGFQAPPDAPVNVDLVLASPNYFRTLGMPLQRGRDIAETDGGDAATLAAVVNQEFVNRYCAGRDPLGVQLRDIGPKPAVIVGVVASAKYRSVRESPRAVLYLPHAQWYRPSMTIAVRSSLDTRSAIATLAEAVSSLDKDLPLFRMGTHRAHLGSALAQERSLAGLLSVFAALALVLSSLGLYGLLSYTTQIRTREFGIRLALGAAPRDLLRMVLLQGLRTSALGLALGLLGALLAVQKISALLFGVQPTDGITFGGIALLMLVVALLASAVPARRAARVQPVRALRYE